jgi:ribosomal protein S12 methylthiotransferase accessory factor
VTNGSACTTPKGYRQGTHRTRSPVETIERFGVHARALGITRIANVTGLDYLGLPVFMAMRPNARSLSVSQGKGIDSTSAMASALMEAIELAHAERLQRPAKKTSYARLSASVRATDPSRLARQKNGPAARDCELAWTMGVDLVDGSDIWVPYELVHANFASIARRKDRLFHCSSNGLASGNHLLEATCAGLCEVIERDATALWCRRATRDKTRRRLILRTVRDPDCRGLLDQLQERGMSVAVWDSTTDIGVACFVCRLQEAADNDRSRLRAFWGAGCHLSREVAFLRAVTEAAQSRLTYIAGSRDDLHRRDYEWSSDASLFALVHEAWEIEAARTAFGEVSSAAGTSFESDLNCLLEKLRAARIDQVAVVDLTDERFAIPVVRVIVPGLESHDLHGRLVPGARARALAQVPR